MRIKVIKKQVFTFKELSESAKYNAIEKYSSTNDSDWHEHTLEDFKTICGLLGLTDVSPEYSGFSSQGDGASFKASYSYEAGSVKKLLGYAPQDKELLRIAKELQALQKSHFYSVSGCISRSGYYSHEMTMSVDLEDRNGQVYGEVEEEFLELFRDLARWLYSTLETEYDYQNSEEAFAETAEANEWEFDSTGKLA